MTEIANYAGLAFGVLGLIATIYLSIKFHQRKAPKYTYITSTKIKKSKDAPNDILIYYKNKNVERVSSTTLWIWNSGSIPIKSDDIPPNNPLIVTLINQDQDITILSITTKKISRNSINVTHAQTSNNTIALSFNFLDFNDGVALEIQHTGDASTLVDIDGVILGAPGGFEYVHTGLSFTSLLAGSNQELSKPFFAKCTLSFVSMLPAIAFWILHFYTKDEITTTPILIEKAISSSVTPDKIKLIIDGIVITSRYKLMPYVSYAFIGFLFLISIFWIYKIWKRSLKYPATLDE